MNRFTEVGGELQARGPAILFDHFAQPGLVERQLTILQQAYFGLIGVNTADLQTEIRQPSPHYQANPSCTDNGYVHRLAHGSFRTHTPVRTGIKASPGQEGGRRREDIKI